jgi:hypothetical protein
LYSSKNAKYELMPNSDGHRALVLDSASDINERIKRQYTGKIITIENKAKKK